jgi:hypothetical protein
MGREERDDGRYNENDKHKSRAKRDQRRDREADGHNVNHENRSRHHESPEQSSYKTSSSRRRSREKAKQKEKNSASESKHRRRSISQESKPRRLEEKERRRRRRERGTSAPCRQDEENETYELNRHRRRRSKSRTKEERKHRDRQNRNKSVPPNKERSKADSRGLDRAEVGSDRRGDTSTPRRRRSKSRTKEERRHRDRRSNSKESNANSRHGRPPKSPISPKKAREFESREGYPKETTRRHRDRERPGKTRRNERDLMTKDERFGEIENRKDDESNAPIPKFRENEYLKKCEREPESRDRHQHNSSSERQRRRDRNNPPLQRKARSTSNTSRRTRPPPPLPPPRKDRSTDRIHNNNSEMRSPVGSSSGHTNKYEALNRHNDNQPRLEQNIEQAHTHSGQKNRMRPYPSSPVTAIRPNEAKSSPILPQRTNVQSPPQSRSAKANTWKCASCITINDTMRKFCANCGQKTYAESKPLSNIAGPVPKSSLNGNVLTQIQVTKGKVKKAKRPQKSAKKKGFFGFFTSSKTNATKTKKPKSVESSPLKPTKHRTASSDRESGPSKTKRNHQYPDPINQVATKRPSLVVNAKFYEGDHRQGSENRDARQPLPSKRQEPTRRRHYRDTDPRQRTYKPPRRQEDDQSSPPAALSKSVLSDISSDTKDLKRPAPRQEPKEQPSLLSQICTGATLETVQERKRAEEHKGARAGPMSVFDQIKAAPKLKNVEERTYAEEPKGARAGPISVFDQIKAAPKLKNVEERICAEEPKGARAGPMSVFDQIKAAPKLKKVTKMNERPPPSPSTKDGEYLHTRSFRIELSLHLLIIANVPISTFFFK